MSEMIKSIPKISIILTCGTVKSHTQDFFNSFLRTQPLEKVELILILPANAKPPSFEQSKLAGVKIVQRNLSEGVNIGRYKAVTLATTEIVVFVEDHTTIEDNLVDILLSVFEKTQADAVGWTIALGNKELNSIVWAGYLLYYIAWGLGVPAGNLKECIPGHNNAYRKKTLLQFSESLPDLFAVEYILHEQMKKIGCEFYFTDLAKSYHYHYYSLGVFLKNEFWFGCFFAENRRKTNQWNAFLRIFYGFGVFLKPLLRWKFVLGTSFSRDKYPKFLFWRYGVLMTLAFIAESLGESLGYFFDVPSSKENFEFYELDVKRGVPNET